VFRGDTRHIHHRLLEAGLSPTAALIVLWALSALFGAAAVLMERLPHTWTPAIVAALGGVMFAVLIAARLSARRRRD
jgi:membrane associated rhomboid family serine protease